MVASGGNVSSIEIGTTVSGDLLRLDAAEIADIRSAIDGAVGVHSFDPSATARNAEAKALAHHRREVADDQYGRGSLAALAEVGQHALRRIGGFDPFESGRLAVEAVKRRQRPVDVVEVAHQQMDAAMGCIGEQVPVQRLIVVPFALLAKLAAHEQQLLSRVGPHEREIGPEIRKFLPAVARHLAEQGSLAVHDLIMAERQDEILREGVDQAEGQIVVVMPAVDRILGDVRQACRASTPCSI